MNKTIEITEKFEEYVIINRKTYAEFLTTFLNNNSECGYVLNLNAEWGAGKTTFLKCWYNELKKDHPVIYFDAWKSDFTHDAMTALVDCFHAQLANPISDNKDLIKSFFTKSSHFIRKSIPSLAVGALKHKTGIDGDESLIEDITDTFGIDIAKKEVGDALKEVLKDILEQRKKVDGIEEFKTTLSAMAEAVVEVSKLSSDEKQYPVYVLIDELDRCRPNYAIEVIETVKHFFNTEHFVFVIATDTQQLQHSIKAIYGEGFNANLYLSRFFNQTVTLPTPKITDYIQVKLANKINIDFSKEITLLNIINSMFSYHNITSLREIDKILDRLLSIHSVSDKPINLLSILTLIILNKLYPDIYSKFINKNISPYKYDHLDTAVIRSLSANNSNTKDIILKNQSYNTEYFLNDCLLTIRSPSNVYSDQLMVNSPDDIPLYTRAIISEYSIGRKRGRASLLDYQQLIELSCIIE